MGQHLKLSKKVRQANEDTNHYIPHYIPPPIRIDPNNEIECKTYTVSQTECSSTLWFIYLFQYLFICDLKHWGIFCTKIELFFTAMSFKNMKGVHAWLITSNLDAFRRTWVCSYNEKRTCRLRCNVHVLRHQPRFSNLGQVPLAKVTPYPVPREEIQPEKVVRAQKILNMHSLCLLP